MLFISDNAMTRTQITTKLANSMRASRKRMQLTQSDTAAMIGVESKSTVCEYEHGKKMPDLVTFSRICRKMKINPNKIL